MVRKTSSSMLSVNAPARPAGPIAGFVHESAPTAGSLNLLVSRQEDSMERRGYPPEFRLRVLELIASGRKVHEVARDPPPTLIGGA